MQENKRKLFIVEKQLQAFIQILLKLQIYLKLCYETHIFFGQHILFDLFCCY